MGRQDVGAAIRLRGARMGASGAGATGGMELWVRRRFGTRVCWSRAGLPLGWWRLPRAGITAFATTAQSGCEVRTSTSIWVTWARGRFRYRYSVPVLPLCLDSGRVAALPRVRVRRNDLGMGREPVRATRRWDNRCDRSRPVRTVRLGPPISP